MTFPASIQKQTGHNTILRKAVVVDLYRSISFGFAQRSKAGVEERREKDV